MHRLRSLAIIAVTLLTAASSAAAQEWATRAPLPAPSGRYPVGVGTIHFTDSTRATSRSIRAADHPIGGFTLAPDGKLLRPGADSLHYPSRPIVSLVRDWALDDALVLRQASALLRAPSASPVSLDLDTTRVGVLGHSLGGAAALEACRTQSLFVACADMDGAPFGDVETAGVRKPILVLLSEPDRRRDPPPRDSAEAARRRRFLEMGRERDSSWSAICALQRGAPCDVVKLRGTGHFSFSDAPFQFPAQLRGVGATLSPMEMHRGVTTRLLAFFDHALKVSG